MGATAENSECLALSKVPEVSPAKRHGGVAPSYGDGGEVSTSVSSIDSVLAVESPPGKKSAYNPRGKDAEPMVEARPADGIEAINMKESRDLVTLEGIIKAGLNTFIEVGEAL